MRPRNPRIQMVLPLDKSIGKWKDTVPETASLPQKIGDWTMNFLSGWFILHLFSRATIVSGRVIVAMFPPWRIFWEVTLLFSPFSGRIVLVGRLTK